MLLIFIFFINILCFAAVKSQVIKSTKPYTVLPFPLELPNRNDRSEQCWLRIEDVEISETLTIYCYLAQTFLRRYIHDYNTRKITEDGINVSLWKEDPGDEEIEAASSKSESDIVDWKLTTIKDPVTNQRLYVTKDATCKIIMYSREGMTNYEVQCDKILYYINFHMNRGASNIDNALVIICIVPLLRIII